jgi:hypothetical protein
MDGCTFGENGTNFDKLVNHFLAQNLIPSGSEQLQLI